MKNVLITILLLATTKINAQTKITITNNNVACTVYVNILSADVTNGNGTCDIGSSTIRLPPGGTSVSFPDWTTFNSAYPFSFAAPEPLSTTTFEYTDAIFQWECPMPACTGSGTWGYMSDASSVWGNCYPGVSTWSGLVCTAPVCTWNNLTGLGLMDNVDVIFN